MNCSDCGEVISATDAGMPCPRCGALDRTVSLSDYGIGTDEIAEITASFPPSPSWQAMWIDVESYLDDLRRWYAGGNGLNVNLLCRAANAFFVACFHLSDYLKKDPEVDVRIKSQVQGFVDRQESLRLARVIVNTHKHAARSPGKRYCYIAEAAARAAGATVVFACVGPDGQSESKDCLELAEDGMQAWKVFLQQHGLLQQLAHIPARKGTMLRLFSRLRHANVSADLISLRRLQRVGFARAPPSHDPMRAGPLPS